jgi:hypothetical protein
MLEKIKTLTDKPVTTIINTHTHGDHVSGNVEFPATVDIVVQANTAENMKKMIPNSTAADQKVPAQTIFQQNGGKGLPKHTFKDKMTIGKGADRSRLVLLRPRPHQRRRVGAVPVAARAARRATSSRARTSRCSTRTTAAARWRSATARQGATTR